MWSHNRAFADGDAGHDHAIRGKEGILAVIKTLIPKAVATFLFVVFARIDRQQAITFFDRLESGECGDRHAALTLLRNRLTLADKAGRRISSIEKLALAFKTWIYFRAAVPISRLVLHPNENWSDCGPIVA